MDDVAHPSQPSGRISVIDPISRAIEWTREVLFHPFDLEKWLVLGFCAWLALLGEGGGGGSSSSWRFNDSRRHVGRDFRDGWEWLVDHLLPVLLIAGVLVTVGLVIWLLVTWLSSRGKFMFLDGVVQNRAAVVEPWRRFRDEARSLFAFRVALGLISLVCVGGVLLVTLPVVLAGVGSRHLEPLALLALVVAGLFVVVIVVGWILLTLVINDFLVPLMYLRRSGVTAAWRELRGLLAEQPGVFLLYLIVKFVLGVVLMVIGISICCLTCCLVLLPYVGKVILLPVHVFARAYPLYFLGQFGPEYARFATLGAESAPLPPAAGS